MILITILAFLFLPLISTAQAPENPKYHYTEASDLTLIGKLFSDTPNPYHRVDTVRFKGFSKYENLQVRQASGLAVVFRTDSPSIYVRTEYGTQQSPMSTNIISAKGFDLYIRKSGIWLFAAAKTTGNDGDTMELISEMDGSMHECLMYFPIFSELKSVQIGVQEGSVIESAPNPFRYRVGIFGSSLTHGSGTSRSGMSYPAQFTRKTGIQLLSLGCSGNAKLQPYFADVLAAADVDALIFDCMSNPDANMIRERLFPFIERVQESHPDIPLIFQRTIYRESRNFSVKRDRAEEEKQHVTDSLMRIACKKYNNVYYVVPNATSPDHLTSVDGTHPNDYGYTLWVNSIEKKTLKILKKNGIK